jgi:hypothetical protein
MIIKLASSYINQPEIDQMQPGYGVVQVLKSDKVRPKYQVRICYDRRVNKRQVGNNLDHDGELPSTIM